MPKKNLMPLISLIFFLFIKITTSSNIQKQFPIRYLFQDSSNASPDAFTTDSTADLTNFTNTTTSNTSNKSNQTSNDTSDNLTSPSFFSSVNDTNFSQQTVDTILSQNTYTNANQSESGNSSESQTNSTNIVNATVNSSLLTSQKLAKTSKLYTNLLVNTTTNNAQIIESNTTQNVSINSTGNNSLSLTANNSSNSTTSGYFLPKNSSTNNQNSEPQTNSKTNTTTNNTINSVSCKVQVHFTFVYQIQKSVLKLNSDMKVSQYGINLYDFSGLQLKIKDLKIENFVVKQNSVKFMMIEVQLKQNSDTIILPNDISLYFSKQIKNNQQKSCIYSFKYVYRQFSSIPLSSQETSFLQNFIPILKQYVSLSSFTFLVTNILTCSYFFSSMISNLNLNMMYMFLGVSTVPSFTSSIMNSLSDTLFVKNSSLKFFNKIIHKIKANFQRKSKRRLQQQQQEEDSYLNEIDNDRTNKISANSSDDCWFGSVGIDANFIKNNISSFMMLTFYVMKCSLLKLAIKLLPKLVQSIFKLKIIDLLNQFTIQLFCFSPIFMITAMQVIRNITIIKFYGKINNILHIFLLFICFMYPIVMFSIISLVKKYSKTRKVQDTQRLLYHCFLISICVFVQIKSLPFFFGFVTTAFITRSIYHIYSFRFQTLLNKIFQSSSLLVWGCYHCCFFYLFIVQIMLQKNIMLVPQQSIKYVGLVIVMALFIGGIMQLVQIVAEVVQMVHHFVKRIYKYCKNKNKYEQKSAKSQEVEKDDGIFVSVTKNQDYIRKRMTFFANKSNMMKLSRSFHNLNKDTKDIKTKHKSTNKSSTYFLKHAKFSQNII